MKKKDSIQIVTRNIAILFACIIIFVLYQLRLSYTNSKKDHLQILTNEKASQVNDFLRFQKEKLAIIGNMDVFIDVATNPKSITKIQAAKDAIRSLKGLVTNITVLTKEGKVIVGEIDLPGTDYSKNPYFTEKKEKPSFEQYYDPLRKQDFYVVAGPIYDKSNKSKIIGTIAYDISLDAINNLLKGASSDSTSEVYLINDKGLLLSRSKFLKRDSSGGILIQEVKSEGAMECLKDLETYRIEGGIEEHEEEMTEYVNYMGDTVYGIHAYTTEIMGCVIGEEGKEEIEKLPILEFFKNIFNFGTK